MQGAEGPSRFETLSRGQIIYKWEDIDDFGVCVHVQGTVCARVCARVCVGGKISMCSLPLHTAEQIGEVVRSHNMRGQPGDERVLQAGWR